MTLSHPPGVAPLAEADLYAACREFVLACALPALDPARVIQGWQNRAALPAGTEDYAVISVLSTAQHGTAVERFSAPDPDPAPPGTLTVAALLKPAVLVEFCGEKDQARLRAQRCAVAARSSAGVAFFNERGMSSLYAEEVREHCFTGDAGQFVRRYATVLHLSLWSGVEVQAPYFGTASLARLENVDAHHGANGSIK